jgi:hypothetical protein
MRGDALPTEEVAVSEVSETELREWPEEQGAGAEELGAGETPLLSFHSSFYIFLG